MNALAHIVTEGATEREVGDVLWERRILSQTLRPRLPEWRPPREGYDQVMDRLRGSEGYLETLCSSPELQRVLLIFDQENSPSPRERAEEIAERLRWEDVFWRSFTFDAVDGYDNLFEHRSEKLFIVLHISDAATPDIQRRDFDGYILQLLQGAQKENIVRSLVPSAQDPSELIRKAEEEITQLMKKNGHPWMHNKSWLYAYITVFQFRQSHVWFARKVVECTPEEDLGRTFQALIGAWERLSSGGV